MVNNNHFFEPQLMSSMDSEFSEFRTFGIGKPTAKQVVRKDKRKEKISKFKEKIKEKTGDGKAIHSVNKFNPAFVTMRGAVLSVLNSNVVGISSSLAELKANSQEHWEQVMQKWYRWGGEKAKFDKAMIRGSKKKALFKDLVEKFQKNKKKGFDGEYSSVEGKGAEVASTSLLVASSLLAATSGVLLAVPELAASKGAAAGIGLGATAFASMGGIFKDYAKKQGVKAEELANIPETADIPNAPLPTDEKELAKIVDDSEGKNEIFGIEKKKFWIGTSVVVAAIAIGTLAYFKFRKK